MRERQNSAASKDAPDAPPPAPVDFEALFDSSPNTYMVLDRDLRFVAFNTAYLRSVQRTPEQLVGRYVFDAFPGDPDRDSDNVGILKSSLERVLEGRRADALPAIHYPIPARGGGFSDRYWSCVHTPLFDDDGQVSRIFQSVVDITELEILRRGGAPSTAATSEILRNARTVQAENRTLTAESSELRQMFDQAPGFIAVLRGPDHVFEIANQAYRSLVGHRPIVGKSVREALPEIAEQGFFQNLDEVYRTGEPYVGRERAVDIQREPGAALERRFIDVIYAPNVTESGTVCGIFVEGHDVTERVQGQERQRLMLDELNHRVKNTLATVQSIASQTLRTTASPEAFASAFEARLMSLSNAHNALTRGHWEGADFHEILAQELEPCGEERFALEGEPVKLSPRIALALSMVMHELATNALKHGSLSADAGRLGVKWTTTSDQDGQTTLSIVWRESEGPPVAPPTRRGFGSRLIDRSLAGELGGVAEMDFSPEGLVCRIKAPLRAEGESERG